MKKLRSRQINRNTNRNKMVQKVVVNVDTTKKTRKRKVGNTQALLSGNQNQMLKMAMFLRPAQAPAPIINVLNKEKEDDREMRATLSQILTQQQNNEMALRNLQRNARMEPDIKDEMMASLRNENLQLQSDIQAQTDILNRQSGQIGDLEDMLRRKEARNAARMADALPSRETILENKVAGLERTLREAEPKKKSRKSRAERDEEERLRREEEDEQIKRMVQPIEQQQAEKKKKQDKKTMEKVRAAKRELKGIQTDSPVSSHTRKKK